MVALAYQLPFVELIAFEVLRLPSNLRQTAAIFAVLPLATDPEALTVKTPDWVDPEVGVVKETVGLAIATVNGNVAQLLCLFVESTIRTSKV